MESWLTAWDDQRVVQVVQPPVVTSAGVVALVAAWLCTHPSEHTRSRYRRGLGRFAGWLHSHRGRGLLDARAEDIIAYAQVSTGRQHGFDHRAHPLRRHNTIATQATAWSGFFEFALQAGVVETNPVAQARALDATAAYPPHRHNTVDGLDAASLRALLVEAHRDPWLGGALGAALLGLLLATRWRPERITTRHLVDVLDQVDTASGRPASRVGAEWVPLPSVVHEYVLKWVEERPTGRGPELFHERSGIRSITAVDLTRLVNRCGVRIGAGDEVTAAQVARATDSLTQRGIDVELPSLAELRRVAPAPEQLALPDDPHGYAPAELFGQQALIPLPANVVPLAGRRS